MISAESLRVPFPSKAELIASGRYAPKVEDLYELWAAAHAEAMELAVRLPEVFGDPPRPAITLRVSRALDDEWYLTMERGLELTAMDPEQHWYEVTAEAVREYQDYFAFADDEGWRFYLPAFLRYYLADFPFKDGDAAIDACERLTDFRRLFTPERNFGLTTPEQRAFVDEFLALCRTWQ